MDRRLGRYVILDELAAGGMGRVHIGKLSAEGGFSRVVAIKVLHAQYASDSEVRSMFLDEARLVASIRHPNVVSTLDVLEDRGELFLIMDYVHGLPLSRIIRDVRRDGAQVPINIAAAVMIDAMEGLHAAHEVRSSTGAPLEIVHRDVSPQNIMVGSDGLARVVDFGVAHATDRLQRTMPGQIKGKASYMAPEQATGEKVDRRADVYGAAVVLWETLAGERLFYGPSFTAIVLQHLQEKPAAPSTRRPEVPPELDEIVLRGLEKRAANRFATAHEMAEAVERAVGRASRSELASWLEQTQSEFFAERTELLLRLPREIAESLRGSQIITRTEVSAPYEPATAVDGPRETLALEATVPATELSASLPHGRVDDPVVPAGLERPRRPTALLVLALLVPLLVIGFYALRRPPASATLATATPALPEPIPPPTETAVAPPPPTVPSAVPTATRRSPSPPPPRRPAPSQTAPSPQASPSPTAPTPQVSCCTPDGTLQLHFHDCVNNCKN